MANLAAHRLDRRLTGLAAALGLTYTRYADDLAFSARAGLGRLADKLEPSVASIVSEEGFRLNPRKTRLLVASGRQRLAGVVVNERLNIARSEYDTLKAVIHNCVRHGPGGQNRDGHSDFRAHLRGRVAWVEAIHPERGARLRAALDSVDWSPS